MGHHANRFNVNLVHTIDQFFDNVPSAVQMNGSIVERFRTTVGVKQGCLPSPTLFNIILERIMSNSLEEHDENVSMCSRNITHMRFADDTNALFVENQELEASFSHKSRRSMSI